MHLVSLGTHVLRLLSCLRYEEEGASRGTDTMQFAGVLPLL